MSRSFLLILCLLCAQPCFALKPNPDNKYWLALKPKLEQYLNTQLDLKLHDYEIVGPSTELTDYLGGSEDAAVEFGRFNNHTHSFQRTVVASADKPETEENSKRKRKRKDQVTIIVHVYDYIDDWITTESVSKGERLTGKVKAGHVKVKANEYRLAASTVPGNKNYLSEESLKYESALRNLGAGEPIMVNMLKHEKVINSGDRVKVTSESATIKLEFECKAISGGNMGDSITLSCPDMGKKSPHVIVTGEGTATLQ